MVFLQAFQPMIQNVATFPSRWEASQTSSATVPMTVSFAEVDSSPSNSKFHQQHPLLRTWAYNVSGAKLCRQPIKSRYLQRPLRRQRFISRYQAFLLEWKMCVESSLNTSNMCVLGRCFRLHPKSHVFILEQQHLYVLYPTIGWNIGRTTAEYDSGCS